MRLTLLLVAIATASMSVASTSTECFAFKGYLEMFNARYGTSNTPLDECGLCHRDFTGSGSGNAYYAAWSGAGGDDAAFVAIENEDSDGDGSLNIEEILATTHPGWTCDTYSSAMNAPPNLSSYVEIDNVGCATQMGPEIDVSPISIGFGTVQISSSATREVAIQNMGDADLQISGLTVSGAGQFTVLSPSAPFPIGPGGSQVVTLQYMPTNEGGDTATLEIASNDADEPTVTIDLSGSGVQSPSVYVDLEISQLKATKRVDSERLQSAEVSLTFRNVSPDWAPRTAVLEAWVDGDTIFTTRHEISDEPGQGPGRFTFGPWIPWVPPFTAGIITWVVRVLDDDAVDDMASVETLVIHRERMAGANLNGADLRGEHLVGCDLTGADLRGADLSRANLSGAIGLSTALSDGTTRYSPGTIFEGASFDPAAAGWALVEDSSITRDHTFGEVKARFEK